MLRKKLVGLFATLAILLTGGLVIATPSTALADHSPCTNWSSWKVASGGWGQWRYCTKDTYHGNWEYWRFQVDDTLTDGYGVHLEMYDWQLGSGFAPDTWNDLGQSCFTCKDLTSIGPVETSYWPAFYDHNVDNSMKAVRLVKGRSASPGPHQSVATATWFVNT